MPKAIPCIGYPTQGDAVAALLAEGLNRHQIAARTGLTQVQTDKLMHRARKLGGADLAGLGRIRPLPQRSDWSPEKLDKARRLFDLTMAEIARALEVTVPELLRAVGPTVGAAQAVADVEPGKANDDQGTFGPGEWSGPAEVNSEAKATEDNAATAERDSEATAGRELQVGGVEPRASTATSEMMDVTAGETAPDSVQERVEPAPSVSLATAPAPPQDVAGPPLYRMKRRGEYLDKSGVGFTRNLRRAWQGTAQQTETIYRRRPEYRDLDVEQVFS